MKKTGNLAVSLSADFVEHLFNEGVNYIEVTKDLHVYFWRSNVFFDHNILQPEPCYNNGIFRFPAGAVYEIPVFNYDNRKFPHNDDF